MKILKKISILISIVIALTGCSQSEIDNQVGNMRVGAEIKEESKQSTENTTEELEYSKEEIEQPQVLGEDQIRLQMVQGLSNLEVIKIKTALSYIIDALEQGKNHYFAQIIEDLESMVNIVEYESFRQDLVIIQKIIQSVIDGFIEENGSDQFLSIQKQGYFEGTKYEERLNFAIKMLSDLSLFGVDYPYDKESSRATQGWPRIFKEETLFNVTATFGNEYPQYIQEIMENPEVSVEASYDLRADMRNKQDIINIQIGNINTMDLETVKAKSLEASKIIYEINTLLIEKGHGVEALREVVNSNIEQLRRLVLECISYLQEGDLQIEYTRILEYLDYIKKEPQGDDFDYDLVLQCIDGVQLTLDDICVTVLGDIDPKINKVYSEVLAMLECSPVLYEWINYEITGEYPKDTKPRTNFFNKPLD